MSPHFLPEIALDLSDEVPSLEVVDEVLKALTEHYGVEATFVELIEKERQ